MPDPTAPAAPAARDYSPILKAAGALLAGALLASSGAYVAMPPPTQAAAIVECPNTAAVRAIEERQRVDELAAATDRADVKNLIKLVEGMNAKLDKLADSPSRRGR
jgi:hypothetical protein